jgi:protein-disulfide isomerase
LNKIFRNLTAAAAILSASLSFAATTTSNVFTPAQKSAIDAEIHRYLVQNPQVLIEAMQAFQAQQQQQQVDQAIPKIKANAAQMFNNPVSPVAGNSKGNAVLVEFYDFRCPHCKDATTSVENLIKANPNLRVIYKDFPIFGGASLTAAKASLAAYKLDPSKYGAFHHALMHFAGELTDKDVYNLAKQAGYNVSDLKTVMGQSWVDQAIKDNIALGTEVGINATPMFVIASTSSGNLNNSTLNNNNIAFVPGAYPQKVLQNKINSVQKAS